MASNLPGVPEVTFGGYSSSLTIPRCKIGTRPWPGNSELTLRITTRTVMAGSRLALKPMGTVNRNDLSPQKNINISYHDYDSSSKHVESRVVFPPWMTINTTTH